MSCSPPNFDFNSVIDRRAGDSIKWNKYAGRDILPLWVADMDFPAPPAVLETLRRRVEHGVMGYAAPWPSLVEAVLTHLEALYGWQVEAEWLVWLPGVVTGLNLACRSVDGDVLTATPVYPPFLSAPRLSGRTLARVALQQSAGQWGWDFAAMEAALTPETRLLLLCHPHNHVGRAWRDDELAELAGFCKRHDLTICSDEIHCGLILDEGRVHKPFAMIDEDIARRCITLLAPSKTYNIPGLACAFAVISDAALRQRFVGTMRGIVPDVNVLGLVAAETAYRDCEDWRAALIAELRSNRDRVQSLVSSIAGLSMTHVEATYLAWIDARDLGVDDPARFFEDAGVGLSNGADFGLPGWVRLNFGCSRTTLDSALERMRLACSRVLPIVGAGS
jgi:cystathionine beta-lyase